MTDATITAWESELKAIVDRLRQHPSDDHAADRARMVVLEKLIADHHRNAGE